MNSVVEVDNGWVDDQEETAEGKIVVTTLVG